MSAAFRRIFGVARRRDVDASGTPTKIVVGLGNPGREYSGNRHNVGFIAVAALAKTHGMHFDKKSGDARIAQGSIDGNGVLLARPQTYMNASGRAVLALLRKYKLTPEDLVVIHDDLDLPTGRIRVRKGGSSGGHKGVQSIIDSIGSSDFSRVRVGIGRPHGVQGASDRGKEVVDYVLGDSSPDERSAMDKAIQRAAEAAARIVVHGVVTAMNEFNSAPLPDSTPPGQPQ